MKRVRDSKADPIFVERAGKMIELRIGVARRGETRFTYLSATEAQTVAIGLLEEVAQILKRQDK